jgi:O-methyltransferase involved in polyketide biosynthesis
MRDGEKALELVQYLDAQEMEDFLRGLAQHFKDSEDCCTNFDCDAIAGHILAGAEILAKRTGN